jgi:hypothetical protein
LLRRSIQLEITIRREGEGTEENRIRPRNTDLTKQIL